MNTLLRREIEQLLEQSNIVFELASLEQLEEIYELYRKRTSWFKQNNIKQWSNYITRHEKEITMAIEKQEYYILKKENEIIAGFEITNKPYYFDDNAEAFYLNKVVTKVGYKNLGSFIFMICKELAKSNDKRYLRLNCIKCNKKLNEIYEKHGFNLVGCVKSDYEYCLRQCDVYRIN